MRRAHRLPGRRRWRTRLPATTFWWRFAAVALATLGALLAGSALGPRSDARAEAALRAGSVSGYEVATPHYSLELSGDRITAVTFRLWPVTPTTVVHAGLARRTFTRRCAIGPIERGSATITCSYQGGDGPRVVDARRITVVAAG